MPSQLPEVGGNRTANSKDQTIKQIISQTMLALPHNQGSKVDITSYIENNYNVQLKDCNGFAQIGQQLCKNFKALDKTYRMLDVEESEGSSSLNFRTVSFKDLMKYSMGQLPAKTGSIDDILN